MTEQENNNELFIRQFCQLEDTISIVEKIPRQKIRILLIFGIISHFFHKLGQNDSFIDVFVRKDAITSHNQKLTLQKLIDHFSFVFEAKSFLDEDIRRFPIPNNIIQALQSLLSNWVWNIDEFSEKGEKNILSPTILAKVAEQLSPFIPSMGAIYTPQKTALRMSIQAFFTYLEMGIPDGFNADSNLSSLFETLFLSNSQYHKELGQKINNIQILDNSVGAGTFLIVFAHLLYNFIEMVDEKTKIRTNFPPEFQSGLFIVNRMLFGVDLDPFAVEISKLRLKFFVLAKIGKKIPKNAISEIKPNIKVGNSLFGFDLSQRHMYTHDAYKSDRTNVKLPNHVFTTYLKSLEIKCSEEELQRINPFHWFIEFPQVKKGFDIAIGNPPFISLKGKFRKNVAEECEREFYHKVLEIDTYRPNLFEAFIYRSIILLKEEGVLCYIIPDRLATNRQFTNLRKKLLTYDLTHLEFGIQFDDVVGNAMILTLKKRQPTAEYVIVKPITKEKPQFLNRAIITRRKGYELLHIPEQVAELFEPVFLSPNCHFLEEYFLTGVGFIARAGTIHTTRESPSEIKIVKGEDITPFQIIKAHWFDFLKENLVGGTQDQKKLNHAPKLLLRKTGESLICCYDSLGIKPEQSLYFLYPRNNDQELCFFLLGVLSSTVIDCYYRYYSTTNRESMPQLKKMDLDRFPLILRSKFISEIARWAFFRHSLESILEVEEGMKDFVNRVLDTLMFQNYFIPQDKQLLNILNHVYKKNEMKLDSFRTRPDVIKQLVEYIKRRSDIQELLQQVEKNDLFERLTVLMNG